MINDFKLGLKLMRHGLQFKYCIVSTILFLVLGLGVMTSDVPIVMIGTIYAMFGGIMVYQLVHSLTCAGLVQSSPLKKRLQTSVPAICTFACMVILNTIIVCAKLWMARLNHTPMTDVATDIMLGSVGTVIVLVYMGMAMKAFWLSTIVFIVACSIGGFFIGIGLGLEWFVSWNVSIGAAVVISYLAVAVGCFLMYLISLALYKKDYSKTTFDSALKRAK